MKISSIKGVKYDQSIQLLQNVNLPNNTEVFIDIIAADDLNKISGEDKLKQFYEIINNWEGKEEYIQTMEQLELDRYRQKDKEILLLND